MTSSQPASERHLLCIGTLLVALTASAFVAAQAQAAKQGRPGAAKIEMARDTVFGLASTRLRYTAPRRLPVPRKVGIALRKRKDRRAVPRRTTVIADVGRVKPRKGKRSRRLDLRVLAAVVKARKTGAARAGTPRAPHRTRASTNRLREKINVPLDRVLARYRIKLRGPWRKARPKLNTDALELDADGWEDLGAGEAERFCDKQTPKHLKQVLRRGPKPGVVVDRGKVLRLAGARRPSRPLGFAFGMFCRLRGIDVSNDFFLALDALILGRQSPPPPDGAFFGIHPNGALGAAEFDSMALTGAGAVRVLADWDTIEHQDDVFTFDNPEAMIGSFAARGMETTPTLHGTSRFIGSEGLRPPLDSQAAKEEWKEYLGRMVQQFGPGGSYWSDGYPVEHPGAAPIPVTKWQIWSEQNTQKYYKPGPNVAEYAELLRISERAIHSVDPSAEIVIGAMTSAPSAIKAATYLDQLYRRFGARARSRTGRAVDVPFDRASVNPYAGDVFGVGLQVARYRHVVDKYDPDAKTQIGEFSWTSDPSVQSRLAKTPKEQAELLAGAFELFMRRREAWSIADAFWYRFRDDPTDDVCRWCNASGLVEQDLSPKPAFRAFKRAAAAE